MFHAGIACLLSHAQAVFDGLGEHRGLPGRVTRQLPECLVFQVVRAERVAVQQQGGLTVQVDDDFLRQQA